MAMHRVRALKTAWHDGKWRVPGTPSAVFECSTEQFDKLMGAGTVAELEILQEPGNESVIVEAVAPQVPADPVADGIPDGFPHAKKLRAAGLTTMEAIRGMLDLTQVPGIGVASAAAILDAIAELDGEEDDD